MRHRQDELAHDQVGLHIGEMPSLFSPIEKITYWGADLRTLGAPPDRGSAIRWAHGVLGDANWVVLDSETTGLGSDAQIVELAILDRQGAPLLDTLVRPAIPIPAEATLVHGISDGDVTNSPPLEDLWDHIFEALRGKRVLIYNARFDRRVLQEEAMRRGLPPLICQAECVMLAYAAFWGGRRRDGALRWQSLSAACRQQGIREGGHRAADDCRATLELVHAMAYTRPSAAILSDKLHKGCTTPSQAALKRELGGMPRSDALTRDRIAVSLPLIRSGWREIRSACKRRSMRVAALLANAHPIGSTIDSSVTVEVLVDYPFHFQQLSLPDNAVIVEWAIMQTLNHPVSVHWVLRRDGSG